MDARQGHLEGLQGWPVLKAVPWGLSVIQVSLVLFLTICRIPVERTPHACQFRWQVWGPE